MEISVGELLLKKQKPAASTNSGVEKRVTIDVQMHQTRSALPKTLRVKVSKETVVLRRWG